MKLARDLEQRLERLVDGASAALFRGRMHPVDIADRLVRQVDFLQIEGPAGPQIPNRLQVSVNPADLDDSIDMPALTLELGHAVEATAADRGWRIGGPVAVDLSTNPAVPRGLIDCTGESVPGPLEPWGQLIGMGTVEFFELVDNRTLVGRALESDVTLSSPEVSRHHAVVGRSGAGIEIIDLGSANGTFRNGARVEREPVALLPGDIATFGNVPFTFRMV